MRYHPVVLMLVVWGLCIAAFTILPFQLENRVMSLYGFFILSLFIAVFCAGALAAALPQAQKPRRRDVTVDFRLADRALMAAGVIAILASLIDTSGRNVLDLADAYQIRSERAGNLMAGDERGGSIWFQLAFLTYPASYIYLVREIGFRARPVLWKVVVFGLMPVTMASLAMGGRAPLFYALLMLIYGFALRKHTFPKGKQGAPGVGPQAVVRPRRKPLLPFRLTAPVKVAIGVLGAVMMIYFVQVFLTRADVAGGVDAMFGVAHQSWGVNFNGPGSNMIFALLGPDGAYLLFVFVWYAVQGLVMSNTIFTSYDGPMLLGVGGIDLVSALMRRVNGQFVADGYAHLADLNVYGFLPSAFGSLYVDFKFFGLIVCGGWGWLAGLVYGKVKRGVDPLWLLAVPCVTLGIVFSTINTPIGFSNGLVTHSWLVVVMILARTIVLRPGPAAPAAQPGRR